MISIRNEIKAKIIKYHCYVHRTDKIKANGIAIKIIDGYVILLNENLSAHTLEKVLIHELLHIELGHLDEYKHLPNSWKEKEVALNMERMEL